MLLVLIAGSAIALCGMALPAPAVTVEPAQTLLDQYVPTHQFHEVHVLRVTAPRERVYAAIKSVTASEIPLFETLTWIRRLGRPAPAGILNAPEHEPILAVATRTSFLLLAEEPGREIVVGTAVVVPPGWRPKSRPTPEGFKALRAAGFALAAMNFTVRDDGPDSSLVTTETRIYTTDASSRRKFGVYWRVIYPGSAFLRRMWLLGIRRRAESQS